MIRSLAIATLLLTLTGAAAAPLQSVNFVGQTPADTHPWTVPARGTYHCVSELSDLTVQWREPDGGVTSETGVLVMLHGIDTGSFCNRVFIEWGTPWANDRNVIVCNVYYRNLPYYPPYDFGIYQAGDVLRGLGQLLELYPEVDTRRLYLMGMSGGGHVALQVLAFTPELWAEVYAHCAITKITREADVRTGLYEQDPPSYGWNVNYCPPYRMSGLNASQRRQLEAEFRLRSPQNVLAAIPDVAHLETSVTLFHGTADSTTDYQHILDMEAAVQDGSGEQTQILDHAGAICLTSASWTFWLLENGDHSYAGALPSLSSRVLAMNTLCPDAFKSRRTSAPSLSIDSALPRMDAWTYRMSGPLANSVLSPDDTISNVSDWALY